MATMLIKESIFSQNHDTKVIYNVLLLLKIPILFSANKLISDWCIIIKQQAIYIFSCKVNTQITFG